MNPNCPRSTFRPTDNAQTSSMFIKLGLKPGSHLPAEGMEPRLIDNILIWVLSKEEAKIGGNFHRVMGECPQCRRIMSAGRLFQHKCAKEVKLVKWLSQEQK